MGILINIFAQKSVLMNEHIQMGKTVSNISLTPYSQVDSIC